MPPIFKSALARGKDLVLEISGSRGIYIARSELNHPNPSTPGIRTADSPRAVLKVLFVHKFNTP